LEQSRKRADARWRSAILGGSEGGMVWSESLAEVPAPCVVVAPGAAEPGTGVPTAGVSKPVRAKAAASSGVAAVVAAREAPAICCNCEATGWAEVVAAGG